ATLSTDCGAWAAATSTVASSASDPPGQASAAEPTGTTSPGADVVAASSVPGRPSLPTRVPPSTAGAAPTSPARASAASPVRHHRDRPAAQERGGATVAPAGPPPSHDVPRSSGELPSSSGAGSEVVIGPPRASRARVVRTAGPGTR